MICKKGNSMQESKQFERQFYIDFLRVIAIMAVVLLHVSGERIMDCDVHTSDWQIMNIYESLARWGVPVFVMISGALFLSRRTLSIKIMYKKYISRLLVAYLFWSSFYAIVIPLAKVIFLKNDMVSMSTVFKSIISHDGVVALWFLPMIIGLYMCVPIYMSIVKSKELTKYFLGLSFLFAICLPTIGNFSGDFLGNAIGELWKSITSFINDMQLQMVFGYSFYFVMGLWLSKNEIEKKKRFVIYFMGILGAVMTVICTGVVSKRVGYLVETYYSNFSINVMLMAIAVFVAAKEVHGNNKLCLTMAALSKYSFGIYLVHIFIRNILMMVGIDTLLFAPYISIILLTLLIAGASAIVSLVLNKIPVINKWIV